jgi:catechol 2,3-dioxygenase-like lactoylglutathione lyase family enzyme
MTGSAGGAQAPEGPAPFAERAGGVDSGCGRLHRPVTEQVIGLATGGTLSCPVFRNVPRRSRSKIEGVSLPVTLPLIDHLALRVRDERRSRTFYEQALEPFGVKVVESSRGPGFAIEGGGDFWIEEGEPPAAPVHVAFAAADRATVDKFHRAAVEAGGRDNGAPGLRPHYHAGYYAAFVIDPDGNNVEAVFHGDRQLPAT